MLLSMARAIALLQQITCHLQLVLNINAHRDNEKGFEEELNLLLHFFTQATDMPDQPDKKVTGFAAYRQMSAPSPPSKAACSL